MHLGKTRLSGTKKLNKCFYVVLDYMFAIILIKLLEWKDKNRGIHLETLRSIGKQLQ